jgi:hypothetical protein
MIAPARLDNTQVTRAVRAGTEIRTTTGAA